jgi:hypothetical protein
MRPDWWRYPPRCHHGHRPLTDKFARQVVDLVIAGIQHV